MLVYVIVPVYNVEKYLRRCLDSIFSQTYNEYLVICVNDGSTDSSLTILKEYKEIYKSKMVLIDKPNGGLSSARNAGLDYIEEIDGYNDNSYITFIDSDDWVSDDYLEVLVGKLEESACDIVCSSYYGVQEDGKSLFKSKHEINRLCNSYEAIKLLFSHHIQSHAQCKLFKVIVWKEFRFDDNKIFMEDQAIMYKIFYNSAIILSTDYAGYYFLIRNGSLCNSEMPNGKILSALYSYYECCIFSYDKFSMPQKLEIMKKANQLLASIYLMMYPRFNKKTDEKMEIKKWLLIYKYVKKNKLILHYRPINKKEWAKKYTYIFFRPLYSFIYMKFIG